MAGTSKIEWTDSTWNPIVGCSIVSPGCTNCYAMQMAWRIEKMNGASGTYTHYRGTTMKVKRRGLWTGHVALAPDKTITAPLRWKNPRRIFVNSMGDLFHESIPDEWIDRVFAVMALCPQHTFQVLTKRAERMRDYCSRFIANGEPDWITEIACDIAWKFKRGLQGNCGLAERPLPNVWLGVSAERQQEADERIPHLLQTPAAIRFVSLEPLLGPIDLWQAHWGDFKDNEWQSSGRTLVDWAIVGGESGSKARPMHPNWVRSLQRQCAAAGVKFFFKQRGAYTWVDDGDYDSDRIPDLPQNWRERTDDKYICIRADGSRADGYAGDSAEFLYRVGKKAAGRLLDGREWNQMPEVRP